MLLLYYVVNIMRVILPFQVYVLPETGSLSPKMKESQFLNLRHPVYATAQITYCREIGT